MLGVGELKGRHYQLCLQRQGQKAKQQKMNQAKKEDKKQEPDSFFGLLHDN